MALIDNDMENKEIVVTFYDSKQVKLSEEIVKATASSARLSNELFGSQNMANNRKAEDYIIRLQKRFVLKNGFILLKDGTILSITKNIPLSNASTFYAVVASNSIKWDPKNE